MAGPGGDRPPPDARLQADDPLWLLAQKLRISREELRRAVDEFDSCIGPELRSLVQDTLANCERSHLTNTYPVEVLRTLRRWVEDEDGTLSSVEFHLCGFVHLGTDAVRADLDIIMCVNGGRRSKAAVKDQELWFTLADGASVKIGGWEDPTDPTNVDNLEREARDYVYSAAIADAVRLAMKCWSDSPHRKGGWQFKKDGMTNTYSFRVDADERGNPYRPPLRFDVLPAIVDRYNVFWILPQPPSFGSAGRRTPVRLCSYNVVSVNPWRDRIMGSPARGWFQPLVRSLKLVTRSYLHPPQGQHFPRLHPYAMVMIALEVLDDLVPASKPSFVDLFRLVVNRLLKKLREGQPVLSIVTGRDLLWWTSDFPAASRILQGKLAILARWDEDRLHREITRMLIEAQQQRDAFSPREAPALVSVDENVCARFQCQLGISFKNRLRQAGGDLQRLQQTFDEATQIYTDRNRAIAQLIEDSANNPFTHEFVRRNQQSSAFQIALRRARAALYSQWEKHMLAQLAPRQVSSPRPSCLRAYRALDRLILTQPHYIATANRSLLCTDPELYKRCGLFKLATNAFASLRCFVVNLTFCLCLARCSLHQDLSWQRAASSAL